MSADRRHGALPAAAVAICTMDRPEELARCLRTVIAQDVDTPIVVVDASRGDRSRVVVRHLERQTGEQIDYLHHAPGLARQRNTAIDAIRERHPEVEVVAFFDDDSLLDEGCLAAMLQEFARDPRVGGVGAPVHEPKTFPAGLRGRVWRALKRLFLLEGRPGRVLRSGRNIMVWETDRRLDVDWVRGSAMAFRVDVFEDHRFDERLVGYSWGEDFDLSFRVSQDWRVVITPDARVLHLPSSINRAGAYRLARTRTVLLHAWVTEHRDLGLSPSAFWWSVVGEIVLQTILSLGELRAGALAQAAGCLHGSVDILVDGSSRSFEP